MEQTLSLYIHIPFCLRKCAYCDFYSIDDFSYQSSFINSAIQEIKLYSEKLSTSKISSIFFGGGTPSAIDVRLLNKLLIQIKSSFILDDDCEITIECNPSSANASKLEKYIEIGINRLSVGAQSFNDSELNMLERLHDAKSAELFLKKAIQLNFNSISLDLIIALPNQNLQSLDFTLEKALSLPIEHLSVYTLILEEGTRMFEYVENGKICLLGEDDEARLYSFACEKIVNAGFEQYEISNFAKNGKYSKHNLNYWLNGSYIGIGPSAHGYINGVRYSNVRSIDKYINSLLIEKKLPIEEENILKEWDVICETFFLGLRSIGVNLTKFKSRFNLDLELILKNEIELWKNENLILIKSSFLSLSSAGRAICDELSAKCLERIEKYYLKRNN